jgi:hypothetical protein
VFQSSAFDVGGIDSRIERNDPRDTLVAKFLKFPRNTARTGATCERAVNDPIMNAQNVVSS